MDDKTKQINNYVEETMSYVLESTARYCASVESDGTDAIVEYSEKNLFDSLLVINHVWQTFAIHSGQFATPKDAEEKMSKFREAIIECFGIDPAELARKIINKQTEDNGTETETNCIDQ